MIDSLSHVMLLIRHGSYLKLDELNLQKLNNVAVQLEMQLSAWRLPAYQLKLAATR